MTAKRERSNQEKTRSNMIALTRSLVLGAVLLVSHSIQHAEGYYLPGALPQSFGEGDV